MGHLATPIRAARTLGSIAFFAAIALGASTVFAGSMPIVWVPSTDADVAGYKVFYGTAPGSYPSSVDVGNVTATTLTGLTDCTRYYVAIKAYDAAGNQSASYSNEVSGLPTATIATSTPASAERGQTLTVTLTGANFDTGAAVTFSDPSITVLSTTFVSCSQVRAQIAIAPTATLGGASLDVTNSDRTFVTRAGALSVLDVTVPATGAISPSAGATGVALSVQPMVSFTEAMNPSSITAGTVQLLLPDGTAVAQGSGSPSLDPTGRIARIAPAASLQYETSYRVRIVGGPAGVLDAQGMPLGATVLQSPGFTTIAAPAPTVTGTTPASGATGVALAVRPSVTFSMAMDPATITAATVRLLLADGTAVAQSSGSPSLDASGTVARITPASALAPATTYRIQIVGGAGGAADAQGTALASTFTQSPGFTTVAPADTTRPTILSTTPADGVAGVSLGVWPTITFSEPLMPSSVNPLMVHLMRADGSEFPQSPSSPTLDATGRIVTIIPAEALPPSQLFRVKILGGTLGVQDLAGNFLATTYLMAPGFTTQSGTIPPSVQSTNPADGATGASTGVDPAVVFNKPILLSSVDATTVQLVLQDGTPVIQAAGSPSLDPNGLTARIVPASPLVVGTVYFIRVAGGSSGIKDVSGVAMVSTYSQSSGFTAKTPPGQVNNLHRKDKK